MTEIREDIRQWLSTHQLPYNGARELLQRISATGGIPASGGIPGSVWLAEKSGSGFPEILGIVSTPEAGKKACQASASEYFGVRNTPPPNWHGDDGHASASYSTPHESFFFQVTRFTVDEIREDTS